jgi:hypothetical protein
MKYPCEELYHARSVDDPIAVKFLGPEAGNFELKCGRCTDWVQTNAHTIEGAIRSSLFSHHKSVPCRSVFRLVQSGNLKVCSPPGGSILLPATQDLSESSISVPSLTRTSLLSTVSHSVQPTKSTTERLCPGVPLVWPSDDFCLDYPWLLHTKRWSHVSKWSFCSYNESTATYNIRARDCDIGHLDYRRPCARCIAVQAEVQKKYASVMDEAIVDTANYHNRNLRRITSDLHMSQKAYKDIDFKACAYYIWGRVC